MFNANHITQYWPEWKVVEKLGEGSFGAVYKCCKTEHGVEVYSAVKVITITKQDYDDDSTVVVGRDNSLQQYFKGYVDDCLEEIRIMSEIRGCANIVYIEDFKVLENESGIGWTVLIRMELLDKFSSYMRTHSFTEEEVIRFGIDICNALQNCNAYNIIHRDVKPSNILMTKNGTYKLSDFGIARKLENAKSGMSIKGNHMYSAPEVFMGKQYNENVDVYSLGILLYQLMNNNRIPFLSSDKSEVSHREVQQALEMRRQDATFVAPCNASAAFTKIILTACDFNPETRYASAAELKKALEGLLMSSAEQTAVRSEPQSESFAPPLQVSHTPQSEPPAPPLQTSNKSHTPSISPKLTAAVVAVLAFVIVGGLVAFFVNKGRDDLPAQTDSPAQVQQGTESATDDTASLVSQAQQLYLDGEYVRSIELYRQIIEKQGTPAAEVKNALAAVENAYRVFILEEAGYLAANNDKAAALAKIDEALRILPDDSRLLERKKQIEATTEPQSATEVQTTTQTPATESNENIIGTFYITSDTPDHEGVNMRKEPDTSAELVIHLYEGDIVEKTGVEQNGYAYCRYNNQYGWILSEFLTTTKVNSAKIIGTYYVSEDTPDHDGVNMRQEPRNTAVLLAELAEGTAVEKTNVVQGDYVYCKYNNQYGWLLSEFLTASKTYTVTVTVHDAKTLESVSGVNVIVAAYYNESSVVASGITDRNGEAELHFSEKNVRISLSCDGYISTSLAFTVSDSLPNEVLMYMNAEQTQADTFTQTYNAALDAYYNFLSTESIDDLSSADCLDISGDGIPDLIVSQIMKTTVYSYDTNAGAMLLIKEMAEGGFADPEIRYNVDNKMIVQVFTNRSYKIYNVFKFDGLSIQQKTKLEYSNGFSGMEIGYTLNDTAIDEATFNETANDLVNRSTRIISTKEETLQKIKNMKK